MTATPSLVSRFAASSLALALAVTLLTAFFSIGLGGWAVRLTLDWALDGYSQSLTEQIAATSDPQVWQGLAWQHDVVLWIRTADSEHAFDDDGEPIPVNELPQVDGVSRVEKSFGESGQVVFFWAIERFARVHDHWVYTHLALLLAVVGATYVFQRGQLRPLQWLRAGVDAVGRGDLDTRVRVAREDEIGQVSEAFNRMTARISAMLEDRERLLGDVSHELRSPLTRMKVALELLPESPRRASLQDDVREMERLITSLLERQRLRAQAAAPDREAVDLVPLTRECLESFAAGVGGVGVIFEAEQATLVASVDAELWSVVVRNLVENACAFTPPGRGDVEVRLLRSAAGTELWITDDGPGIPAEAAERVFEPFVKLDPARGHGTGYGLGLNLCRRIVEAHGGAVDVVPRARGARLRVVLPTAG